MRDGHVLSDYEAVKPSRRRQPREADEADPYAALGDSVAEDSGAEDPKPPAAAEPSTAVSVGRSLLKRGHAVSYAGVFLFTLLLLFRPYELIPALSFLSTSAFWLALATLLVYLPSQFTLEGNLSAGLREVFLILLLALAALTSIPLARNPLEAWETFNDTFIKAVLIFIVTVNVVRTERRLKGLLYLSLGVTILLSVAAVKDYSTGNFTVEGYRINGLIGGMFGNPNDLALHLVTMTPLFVTMMLSSRNPVGKMVYGVGGVLSVVANVVTYSRAGFLGLLGMAVVLLWKLGRGKRFKVSAVGAVCLALFISLSPGSYGIRILSIFIPALDPVGSSTHRQGILNRSVLVSLRNPVVGIGMGNFHIVSLGEAVAHNAYTQVSAELGLPALLFYLMLMVAALRRMKRLEVSEFTPRKRSRHYYLSVGLQASIVGYMISSFFASVAYQWYVYYLVAYAVCLSRIVEAQPAPVVESKRGGKPLAELKASPVGARE